MHFELKKNKNNTPKVNEILAINAVNDITSTNFIKNSVHFSEEEMYLNYS